MTFDDPMARPLITTTGTLVSPITHMGTSVYHFNGIMLYHMPYFAFTTGERRFGCTIVTLTSLKLENFLIK